MNAAITTAANMQLDVEKARAFLARCRDVDEVKSLRDKAEAVSRYMRTREAGEEMAIDASVIARRAERRLGELLREMPKAKGATAAAGPGRGKRGSVQEPRFDAPTLADRGIDKKDSMRWQAIASVPEKTFEQQLRECIERGKAPTAAAFVRLAKAPAAPAEPEPFHILIASGELKDALRRVLGKAMTDWPKSSRPAIAGLLRDLAAEIEVECADAR